MKASVKNIEAAGRTLWRKVGRPHGCLMHCALPHTGSPHGRHEITPENFSRQRKKGQEKKNHIRRVHVIYSRPELLSHLHLDWAVRLHVSVWALRDALVFRVAVEPCQTLEARAQKTRAELTARLENSATRLGIKKIILCCAAATRSLGKSHPQPFPDNRQAPVEPRSESRRLT